MADLEIARKRELITIESEKFKSMIDAIGQQTIVEMARLGPETQMKLLQSLGLNGYMITDGKSPINLVATADGLIRGVTDASAK